MTARWPSAPSDNPTPWPAAASGYVRTLPRSPDPDRETHPCHLRPSSTSSFRTGSPVLSTNSATAGPSRWFFLHSTLQFRSLRRLELLMAHKYNGILRLKEYQPHLTKGIVAL